MKNACAVVRGNLGERALDEGGFDRILSATVFGRSVTAWRGIRELHEVLNPSGVL